MEVAQAAAPFRSLVNPDDPSFLSPPDMTEALQDYCRSHGEPVPDSAGQLVRCALESLALKYRHVLEGIESLTGERVAAIHVVGGGSKNELLNQFTANACGRPVIAGPTEATALGNLLLQARTAGDVGTLGEIRAIVRASCEMRTYEPLQTPAWDEAYTRFLKLAR
ncbi:MAG: FGGY-family carbohydrate kinase [Planctomycetaceae bacterium]